MLLVEKYKPRALNEVRGQEFPVKRLKEAVECGKSCLIYGGVGNGKTSAVYALANELGYEVFELNASEGRSKEAVNSALNKAVMQGSLFNKNKIILIDDIDALTSNDRGGLQAITEFLDNSCFPFVFTCYSIEDGKFRELKRKCNVIEFEPVNSINVFEILKGICAREKVNISDELLKEIARRCDGDVRAGINELQIAMLGYGGVDFSYKDGQSGISELLNIVFKSKNPEAILKIMDRLDVEPDEAMLWIDENLPLEYKPECLEKAYAALSKADVFKGRIRKRQYYRYVIYQKLVMSMGVALAKDEKKKIFTPYKRTSRLLKIWMANRKFALRKSAAEKIGEKTHMSRKKTVQEMAFMGFCKEYKDYFELSDEEIGWFNKK
ncbi:MAG TPA: AAA family ATPase [Candidatus Nanoarchaeia archaeon]|nr:AAA family ATPase [Candidatus Nanoarchaeia archaeon]